MLAKQGLHGTGVKAGADLPLTGENSDWAKLVDIALAISRTRKRYFAAELFSSAPWDLLFALYRAQGSGRPVSVMEACVLADCPRTTGLRWISKLAEREWIERTGDVADRRSSRIKLSRKGLARMDNYLALAKVPSEQTRSRGLPSPIREI